MRPRNLMAAAILVVAGLAACSSAATPTPATAAPATATPATAAPATAAPASSGAPAAGGVTIKTATVGSATLVVASSNGMTVYTFTKDTKDSGKSACSGGCATTWPALTVAAGVTPTGDTGVTGKIATITRDDGTIQVTYNGLPLYFFSGEKAPGDAKGVYTNWESVKP
jgi:predicted lipoprotein with Yx(FWY)xxD motif